MRLVKRAPILALMVASTFWHCATGAQTAAERLKSNLLKIGQGKGFVYASSTGYVDWKTPRDDRFRRELGLSPLLYAVEFRYISGTWYAPKTYSENKTNLTAMVKREYAERRAVPMVTWHLNNPYIPPGWNAAAEFRYRYGVKGYPEKHRWILREIVEGSGEPCGDGRVDGKGEQPFPNPRTWFEWCLKDAAEFCRTWKDEEGNQIPVILRPFHECDCDWFWWGSGSASPQDFIAAFRLMVEVMRRELGTRNVLFAYSPDRHWDKVGVEGVDGYLCRYPGDDWVELIGFDDYELGKDHANPKAPVNADKTTAAVIRRAQIVSQVGREHGKICGLFESGAENSVDSFYTEMFKVMTAPGVDFAIATTYNGVCTWPQTLAGKAAMKAFFELPQVITDRSGTDLTACR